MPSMRVFPWSKCALRKSHLKGGSRAFHLRRGGLSLSHTPRASHRSPWAGDSGRQTGLLYEFSPWLFLGLVLPDGSNQWILNVSFFPSIPSICAERSLWTLVFRLDLYLCFWLFPFSFFFGFILMLVLYRCYFRGDNSTEK